MNITYHALKRCRQRGIPEYFFEVIRNCGTVERRPYGAIRIRIKKRDCDEMLHRLRRYIQEIEKIKRQGICVILTEDGESVITTYRKE